MTIQPVLNGWLIDLSIPGQENPTGKAIRFRRRFRVTQGEAKALDREIEAALRRSGEWKKPEAPEPAPPLPAVQLRGKRLRDALLLAWEDVEEGWNAQRTGQHQEARARSIVNYLGPDRTCASIVRADFMAVRRWLEEAKDEETGRPLNAPGTVRQKMQAFSRVLYFAEKAGWISKRPSWKSPKLPEPRQFVFSKADEAVVLAMWPKPTRRQAAFRDLFTLGIDAGFRLQEMLKMRAADVDLTGGFATVTAEVSKTGKPRQVVLVPRALAVLKARSEGRVGDDIIFPELHRFAVTLLMDDVRKAIGQSANRECVFHSTRHTHGTRMAEREVPLPVMMDQLGHTKPDTTLRYVHLAAATRKRTLLEKMAAG